MKKFFKIMASVLMIAAFAAVAVSCSKEEEDDLIGRWMFQKGSAVFYLNGESYDGELDPSYFSEFHGMYFEFQKSGNIIVGIGAQSAPAGSYSVSGDKITINDGSTSFSWKYRISGTTLDLIWSRADLEFLMGELPEEFYYFDDVDVILTFTRAD
jgi:hypothetical protein